MPQFLYGKGIITYDPNIRIQRTDKLKQIVGKAVIVINQKTCVTSLPCSGFYYSAACSGIPDIPFGNGISYNTAPLLTKTFPFFL